jgi:diguanylate cyclase (GGDEF)-like protein
MKEVNVNTGKNGWGLGLFLCSPLLIGALLLIALKHNSTFTHIIHIMGMIFSILCFTVGHFSYPRVQNLKVYLCGYLTGLLGLHYFLPFFIEFLRPTSLENLLFIAQINLFIILLLPSYTKFRVAKLITWIITLGELSLFASLTFITGSSIQIFLLTENNSGILRWTMVFWPIFILILSFIRVKREFYLGGILTGCSYFFSVAFMNLMGKNPNPQLNSLLLAAAPFYLILGTTVHLFTRMEHRAFYDPLMHIYNRNFCSSVIEEGSKLNTSPPFGVAMVDIDYFKKVNDTWGHGAGDRVLIGVAQTIQREVVPEGVLCRYGGEELAIFFPKKESKYILPIMENARKAIESLRIPVGPKKTISVTISCGISHRKCSTQRIMEVIQAADKALYRAKESGRNQVWGARSFKQRK